MGIRYLNVIKNHRLWPAVGYGIVVLSYLFIMSGIFFVLAPDASYDDGLQFNLAQNIAHGRWLGDYSSLTLVKGPTFPIWIASLHILDIPLWIGDSLLAIIAAACITIAVSIVMKNKWLALLIFIVTLFNPMISLRVYRDSIAPYLVMMIVAWGISIALSALPREGINKSGAWKTKLLTGIAALALPAWWYLREDYFWALPFVVGCIVVLGVSFLYHRKQRKSDYKIDLKLVAMAISVPFITVGIANVTIRLLNYHYYGVALANDYTEGNFPQAYGALLRIKDDSKPIMVPVSTRMRDQAYKVSPTFRSLQPCLDAPDGKGACEFFRYNNRAWGEYEGGWFFWAMRYALDVNKIGNARDAQVIYKKIAVEINSACDQKVINCVDKHIITVTAPPSAQYIAPVMRQTGEVVAFMVSLQQAHLQENGWWVSPMSVQETPSQEQMADFLDARYDRAEINPGVRAKESISNIINTLYKVLNRPLAVAAVTVLVILSILWKKLNITVEYIVVCWGLIMLLLLRCVMLAYVDVTAFPAINTLYLSSAYPLMFTVDGAIVAYAIQIVLLHRRRRKAIQ